MQIPALFFAYKMDWTNPSVEKNQQEYRKNGKQYDVPIFEEKMKEKRALFVGEFAKNGGGCTAQCIREIDTICQACHNPQRIRDVEAQIESTLIILMFTETKRENAKEDK